ncbi:hypothetical protein COA18_05265 [Priestia megaterium]|nr:hypothetical protein COA18_05265 [Priestia megaterium]
MRSMAFTPLPRGFISATPPNSFAVQGGRGHDLPEASPWQLVRDAKAKPLHLPFLFHCSQ